MAAPDPVKALAEGIAWIAGGLIAAHAHQVSDVDVFDCRGRATRASGAVLAARRSAIYLASIGGNLAPRALSRASGMTPSNIRHHLAIVEEAREGDAALDGRLEEMTELFGFALLIASEKADLSPGRQQSGNIDLSPARQQFGNVFGLAPATARLLARLTTRAPAPCFASRVQICRLRQALAARGHAGVIVTHPGLGYSIAAAAAAALRQAIVA